MAVTLDSLQIEIKSSATQANNSINRLCSSLEHLQSSLAGVESGKMQTIASDLNAFTTAMRGLSNVRKPDYNRLTKGLETIAGIDSGALNTASQAIGNLVNPISQISNLNFNQAGITSFINSITRLSGASSQVASIDFSELGSGIASMISQIEGVEKVSSSVIQFTNAVSRLAQTGNNATIVASTLPQLGSALQSFFTTMSQAPTVSEETVQFTSAVGQLASAGENARITAGNLGILATELRKFFAEMSKAPAVKQNTIDMTKALADLAQQSQGTSKAVRSLSNVGTSLSRSFSGFTRGSKQASNSAFSLAAAFGKFYATYWLVIRAIRGVAGWMKLASSLYEVQNVVDVTFGKMSSRVEEFSKDSIKNLGMSELSVKQYASRFQAMGRAMGISSQQVSDAHKFLSEVTRGYDKTDLGKPYVAMSKDVSDLSLNLTKLTADISSFYDVEQSMVAKSLQSGVFGGQARTMRQYGIDLSNATLEEWALNNGMNANIKTMTQAEKTMLRYQYVMAQMKDVHGDFARTSNSWANQVRILKQQFQQLGVVVGRTLISAFKPLLSALNKVLSAVIVFAESIGNALGKIFGWKLEIHGGSINEDLEEYSGAMDDASDAMSGIGDSGKDAASGTNAANKAAEEYKKTLLGFDKINKLSEPDTNSGSGSGGSGGSSGSGSGGAGGTPTSAELVQEANTILSAYESGISNLYSLGASIRDKLMEVMDGIDWDSIYQKARNFGIGLADFLNGLFANNSEGRNVFQSLGRTIAGAINTAFNASDAFSAHFNFTQLGTAIGSGVNEFMDTLQWSTIFSSARNWGVGIANAINGFLKETDFYSVGRTIANYLNTGITFAFNLAATLDEEAIGNSIANSINGFFSTFDFKKAASTLNTFADKLKGAVKTALEGITWSDILQGISDFTSGLDLDTIAIIAGGFLFKAKIGTLSSMILTGLSNSIGIANILNGIMTLSMPELILEFTTLGFSLPGTPAFDLLTEPIVEAIGKWWNEKVPSKIDDVFEITAGAGIGAVLFGIPGAIVGAIAGAVGDYLNDGNNVAVESVLKLLKTIFNFDETSKLFEQAKEDFKKGGPYILAGIIEGLKVPVTFFFEPINDLLTALANTFANIFGINNGVSDKTKGVGESIHGGIIEGFKSKFSDLQSIVSSIPTKIMEWVSNKTGIPIDLIAKFTGWELNDGFDKKVGGMKADFDKYTTTGNWVNDPLGDFDAKMTGKKISGTWNTGTLGDFDAKFTGKKASGSWNSGTWGNFDAKFTGKKSSGSWLTGSWGGFSALFTGKTTAKNATWKSGNWGSFTAYFTKKKAKEGILEGLWGKFTALFTGTKKKADGGVLTAAGWKPIQKYAGGGTPGPGQLFIAREAGPELVGKLNGHTAVLNNDQIVSSVAAGVSQAVASVMSRYASANQNTNINVTLQGDAGKVFTLVRDENNRRVRATRMPQFLV